MYIHIFYFYVVFSITTDHLRITTFNCNGLKSSIQFVQTLCDNYDILFLQETWLLDTELYLLKQIHKEFDGFGISSVDTDHGILTGRPYGGLGVLWRKDFNPNCHTILYDDTRLLGLELCNDGNTILFLNVYLPYQCSQNFEDYTFYLGKIHSILADAETSQFIVTGDFNAAVGSVFESELLSFCETTVVKISDYEIFGRDSNTFTYLSDAHGSTSWLDHKICSHNMHSLLHKVTIHDKSPCLDLLPLGAFFNVVIPVSQTVPRENVSCDIPIFNWSKADDRQKEAYRAKSISLLNSIKLPTDVLSCTDKLCDNVDHVDAITSFYENICKSLRNASSCTINMCKSRKLADYIIPGWNDYVEESHQYARYNYVIWRDLGKPRQGSAFELMRRSRLNFKYVLRQCKAREEMARADSMANKWLGRI